MSAKPFIITSFIVILCLNSLLGFVFYTRKHAQLYYIPIDNFSVRKNIGYFYLDFTLEFNRLQPGHYVFESATDHTITKILPVEPGVVAANQIVLLGQLPHRYPIRSNFDPKALRYVVLDYYSPHIFYIQGVADSLTNPKN